MKKVLILMLSLFIVVGCAPSEKKSDDEEIELIDVSMGDVLELDTLKFKVLKIEEKNSIEGKFETVNTDDKSKFLIVELEITNTSKEDLTIGEEGFTLYSEEYSYSPDGDNSQYVNTIINQKIPSGKTLIGNFYYVVHKEVKDFFLVVGHAGTGEFFKYNLEFEKEEVKEDPKDKEVVKDMPKETPKPADTETMGQKNAVKKAESYLNYTAFSRSGLIDQLIYEGFSEEDSTYAVDNVSVDWYEQAAQKAQSYLDYTSFSRQGLIDQLLFEGFSADEAEYGVTEVGY